MTDAPQTEDPMVAALLREREGYVQRGMDDRVAQVDEQLRLRGAQPPAAPDTGTGTGTDTSTTQDAPKTSEERAAAAEQETRTEPPKGRRPRAAEKA
jgi:hypothetical protein